jgi:hypothetical protein
MSMKFTKTTAQKQLNHLFKAPATTMRRGFL